MLVRLGRCIPHKTADASQEHPGLLKLLYSRCVFAPIKSALMKSCNTRAGDESKLERCQEQQTQPAQRAAVCVMEGPVLWFPLLLWGTIQPHSQRAPNENTGPLQILQRRALNEQHRCALRGNVLSVRGWITAKRQAPRFIFTAGWRSRHLQRPSITTEWNEESTHEV